MGILALNNTADIDHHPALGLPGLDLEPEIYYPPRFVLCVMGTDPKQRGVRVRRKIFPFIPRWVCPPWNSVASGDRDTPVPYDDRAWGSQHRPWGGSTQTLNLPFTSMTL